MATTHVPWRISMSAEAWELFWSYTELITGEVACFGYTELDVEHHEIFIPEIFLVPQVASASEVDFISTGLPYAIEKALTEGRIDDLRFCIHSHGEFGAQWSSTDEDMIRKIGSTGTPWFASAIFNKKGARTGRIDIFGDTPFGRTQHTLKDLDVRGERGWEYDSARCDELDLFVKKPAPPVKKEPKLLGQATPVSEPKLKHGGSDKCPVTMTAEGVITVNGTDIDLNELPMEAVMKLAQQFDWEWAEDSTGTRYYWDTEGEVFFEARQFNRPFGDHEAEDDVEYENVGASDYSPAAI